MKKSPESKKRRASEPMYYRIGEAAELVGEKPHVLRYWEAEFHCVHPSKSTSGQRVYSRRDVEMLLRIKELLKEKKFTLEGARRKLREGGFELADPTDATRLAVDNLRKMLLEVRDELLRFLEDLEVRS